MRKRMAGCAEVARGRPEGDAPRQSRRPLDFVPQLTLLFSLFSLLIPVLKESLWRMAVWRSRKWVKTVLPPATSSALMAKTFLDVICTVGVHEEPSLCCGRICVQPHGSQPCM